jgi:hypothetical protein
MLLRARNAVDERTSVELMNLTGEFRGRGHHRRLNESTSGSGGKGPSRQRAQ